MGKITDIQKQKRNRTRVSVYIDGEFVCGLDEVAAAKARLKVGGEIDEAELKAVMFDSELNSAFERAVAYLGLSPRARKEIEKYLLDKGYDRAVVYAALKKLDDYRYIDDRLYAESLIKSKSKKYGTYRLKAELKKKGIAQEIIDELLDEGGDDNVYAVAQKYVKSHRACDRQKLKRFLAGRGFSWDSIDSAVSRLNAEGAFDSDDNDDY